ncbi:hypothetical protein HPB58_13045 [Priestia filamentosa]|uniref:hypothetical protein n=1 Tax=Priestia filamentosa TaxID=1402861 RepID=UPI001FB31BD9|nr:hypothetical protein [Priestia filamentosa]UOE58283.1 hypothetical protein HPB58_13045 [Priestia filamentosa]
MIHRYKPIDDYKLSSLFDRRVLQISQALSGLVGEKESYIPTMIKDDTELFTDLLGDWGTLSSKNRLTSSEQECLTSVRSLIQKKENT